MKIVDKSVPWVEPKTTPSSSVETSDEAMEPADLKEAWLKAEAAVTRERNEMLLRHEEIVRLAQEKAKEKAREKALEKAQQESRDRQSEFLQERKENAAFSQEKSEALAQKDRLKESALRLAQAAESAKREDDWRQSDRLSHEMESLLRRMEQVDEASPPLPGKGSISAPRLWMG